MSKRTYNEDFSRKYNVGDIIIFKQRVRNFTIPTKEISEKVNEFFTNEGEKCAKAMTKFIKPYLVKGKPNLTYGGITKITKIDDNFRDFVYYFTDENDGEIRCLVNCDIIKKLSMGEYEYEILKKLSKGMSIGKLLKTLEIKHEQ